MSGVNPIDIAAEIIAGDTFIKTLPDVLKHKLIGSATYMENANDVDFAVLLDPTKDACNYTYDLSQTGWGVCGDYDSESGTWMAVRQGNLNLMITHDPVFYDRYLAAMEVCRALNLQHKEDRVAVCQIVRDGRTADQVWTSGQARGGKGIAA